MTAQPSQPASTSGSALTANGVSSREIAQHSRPRTNAGLSWAISSKELIALCQRVGQGLKTGVDIRRVWKMEATRGSATHRGHMERIFRQVSAGGTVADAMRDCGGYIPPLTCQMVEIGEKTGKLDEVLLRLAKYYEQQTAMQRTFWMGIAWPAFQLLAGVFVIAGVILITGMLPSFGGAPVDILGFGLTGGWGAILFLCSVFTVIGGVVIAINALLRGWLGSAPMQLAMRLPVIGPCLESFALSRLTWSFALGLESGMDARRVVELAVAATQNVHYEQHAAAISAAVGRGQSFAEAFQQTHAFPDEFVFALETAEIAGATSESLLRLTTQYEQKAADALRILTMIATALVWIMVALLIILAIARLAMFVIRPYQEAFDMLENGI